MGTKYIVDDNGNVGIGGTIDADAILTVTSTTKGIKVEGGTEVQRDAIPTPTSGLFFYNQDADTLDWYNGTSWEAVGVVTGLVAGSVLFASSTGGIGEDDANFFWDNSTKILRVGTSGNNVQLENDGITLVGTARKKKTIVHTVGDITESNGTLPIVVIIGGTTPVFEFRNSQASRSLLFGFQMPYDYEDGTDLTLQMYWAQQATGTSPALAVKMDFDISDTDTGDIISASPAVQSINTAAIDPGTVDLVLLAPTITITGTTFTKTTQVNISVDRDEGVADNYSGHVRVLRFVIEYTSNVLGDTL